MGTDHTFNLVGGHPALDLVNTVGWRPDPTRTVDHLADLPTALRWAVAAGVLDAPTAEHLTPTQQPTNPTDGADATTGGGPDEAGGAGPGGAAGAGTGGGAGGGAGGAEAAGAGANSATGGGPEGAAGARAGGAGADQADGVAASGGTDPAEGADAAADTGTDRAAGAEADPTAGAGTDPAAGAGTDRAPGAGTARAAGGEAERATAGQAEGADTAAGAGTDTAAGAGTDSAAGGTDRAASAEAAPSAGAGADPIARGGAERTTAGQAEHAMRRLVALRERLYQVLSAVAQGRAPDHAVLAELHADVARAMRRAEPAAELPLRSTLTVRRPADLVDLLALRAGELLRSAELDRLGQCADTSCGWLFLDRTRSRSRRWCSSADCGNRDRARRHYARTHT